MSRWYVHQSIILNRLAISISKLSKLNPHVSWTFNRKAICKHNAKMEEKVLYQRWTHSPFKRVNCKRSQCGIYPPYKEILVSNFFFGFISISVSLSDRVRKISVLNTARTRHEKRSLQIWARFVKYLSCDMGLKTQHCTISVCTRQLPSIKGINVVRLVHLNSFSSTLTYRFYCLFGNACWKTLKNFFEKSFENFFFPENSTPWVNRVFSHVKW